MKQRSCSSLLRRLHTNTQQFFRGRFLIRYCCVQNNQNNYNIGGNTDLLRWGSTNFFAKQRGTKEWKNTHNKCILWSAISPYQLLEYSTWSRAMSQPVWVCVLFAQVDQNVTLSWRQCRFAEAETINMIQSNALCLSVSGFTAPGNLP